MVSDALNAVTVLALALSSVSFFFNVTATSEIYTLSLHDALPISPTASATRISPPPSAPPPALRSARSEEHTSELQSREKLVCRLLLEKKQIQPEPFVRHVEIERGGPAQAQLHQ